MGPPEHRWPTESGVGAGADLLSDHEKTSQNDESETESSRPRRETLPNEDQRDEGPERTDDEGRDRGGGEGQSSRIRVVGNSDMRGCVDA